MCRAILILCSAADGSNIMAEILCAAPDGRAFCKICICRVGVAVIFMCGHFEIAPLAHRLMNYGSILNTSLPGAQKVSPFNEDFWRDYSQTQTNTVISNPNRRKSCVFFMCVRHSTCVPHSTCVHSLPVVRKNKSLWQYRNLGRFCESQPESKWSGRLL